MARLAGLKPEAAEIIATASQYVDDVSSRRNKVDKNNIVLKNASSPTAKYLDKKLDSFFRKFGFQGGL